MHGRQTLEINEKYTSQIPALQELINLGFEYLPPSIAIQERGGKYSNIFLENILKEQIKAINHIHYHGEEHSFSEQNIQSAVQKLKNMFGPGLKTNENIYNLLTLGTTLEQRIEGNSKSYHLNYIDWQKWDNNVFHATAEFSVERARSNETIRPDIVLFVNGIPLVVIECKSPERDIKEAISQTIRNQGREYSPQFFAYIQLLMAVSTNDARYGTVGSAEKFWGKWKESEYTENEMEECINLPLSLQQQKNLFSEEFQCGHTYFIELENAGRRLLTEQDKAIYCLCRPQRLLDLIHRFIVYDQSEKKIARYQQFFVVRSAVERIKEYDEHGRRLGGLIWHTQGSGKSLTMVMLVRTLLALRQEIKSPRIILVTDRKDLDKQLGNVFKSCGLDGTKRATSGRDLVKHIKNGVPIITTLIHKFSRNRQREEFIDESANVIVLVDESHRTNFDELAIYMRSMLPNACYLGFTGTPLFKERRNNFVLFGKLLEPHYTVRQAIEDKAVLPLLYEGRHVEMEQNEEAVDLWFERHTAELTKRQKADLKKKYARAGTLSEADRVIYMRAYDISEHYRANWQGTGLKAQLVAPSKAAAIDYYKYFKEIGAVTSEVIISAPDLREGHEEVDEVPANKVFEFWKKMMQKYGKEETYAKTLIARFKDSDTPEILIVVDKLLTGFDAPRNTVLYLCRNLRGHTLLQAIARVNRLHRDKDFGYVVDYAGILGEFNEALTSYDELAEFNEDDLAETLVSIDKKVEELPKVYYNLCDIFREIRNSSDEENYERLLADESVREQFYACFYEFSKTLSLALSTNKFMMTEEKDRFNLYKKELKKFCKLKRSVQWRYADTVKYRDYEPKIKKLLDTHIQANKVTQINEPFNIFDEGKIVELSEDRIRYKSKDARADAIVHKLKRVINEKMEEDPALYRNFSKLIQQAIDDFRAERISGAEYLKKADDIGKWVVSKQRDNVPAAIKNNDDACAYYGIVKPFLLDDNSTNAEEIAVQTAVAIQDIIKRHWVVNFWGNYNAMNRVKGAIEDFLYDKVEAEFNISLSTEQMDKIMESIIRTVKRRRRSL